MGGGAAVGSTGGVWPEQPLSPSHSSVPAPVGSGPAALISAAPEELMTEPRTTAAGTMPLLPPELR